MKRSQFCKKVLNPALACGCALVFGKEGLPVPALQEKSIQSNPNETPCDEKVEFTKTWVKRFFDVVDQNLDKETRYKLLQTNGMFCAKGAYGEVPERGPATMDEIDATIAKWQADRGKEMIRREGNTIYFQYIGNKKGLKVADGFCLCPMVENGPATLSPTYCQCSVGYVRYMMQRYLTYKPVEVELLEALRMGGKACRFKVTI